MGMLGLWAMATLLTGIWAREIDKNWMLATGEVKARVLGRNDLK